MGKGGKKKIKLLSKDCNKLEPFYRIGKSPLYFGKENRINSLEIQGLNFAFFVLIYDYIQLLIIIKN
jgi:hypothetical protein